MSSVRGQSDDVAVAAEEVEEAKALHQRIADWNENGRPPRAKLDKLAPGWLADELGL